MFWRTGPRIRFPVPFMFGISSNVFWSTGHSSCENHLQHCSKHRVAWQIQRETQHPPHPHSPQKHELGVQVSSYRELLFKSTKNQRVDRFSREVPNGGERSEVIVQEIIWSNVHSKEGFWNKVGSCFWTKKLHNFSWGIGKLCHLLIHRNALNLCHNQIIMWRKTKLRFKKKSQLNISTIVLKNSHPLSVCVLAAGGSVEV